MIFTEKEAEKAWCPAMSIASLIGCGVASMSHRAFKPEREDGRNVCIGPRCAMWRWDSSMPTLRRPKTMEELLKDGCDECAVIFAQHLWTSSRAMYVGDGSGTQIDVHVCPRCEKGMIELIDNPDARRGYCGLGGPITHR